MHPERERRRRTTRRILAFFRPYRIRVAAVIVAILATSLLGLINPILLKLLIDEAIPKLDFGLLNLFVGLMIAFLIQPTMQMFVPNPGNEPLGTIDGEDGAFQGVGFVAFRGNELGQNFSVRFTCELGAGGIPGDDLLALPLALLQKEQADLGHVVRVQGETFATSRLVVLAPE